MASRGSRRLQRRVNRRFYRCLFRLYRIVFPTPPWTGRIPAASLRRALVIRDDGYVGDMVVTTPLLAFLKEALPQAEIDVLASPTTALLLAADTRVTRVFTNDRTWRGWLRVLRALRARRYDAVFSVIYGKGLREGLTASMIAHRATSKVSIWRPKRYRGFFTVIARPPSSLRHMADQLLYLGHSALGMRPPSATAHVRYPMHIAVDDASDSRAVAFLTERGISGFIVVNVDSTDRWREWRPKPCAEFVAAILERHPDMSIVLPPPPGKERNAEEVVRLCGSSRVVVARAFRALELTALLRRSVAVVTPNTGALHLAAAAGRPIVALYTLQTVHVERWLPWGVPYRAVVGAPGQVVSDIPPARIVGAFADLYHAVVDPAAAVSAVRVP
jgi:ADP-heptose:LPS heptosyltransferase